MKKITTLLTALALASVVFGAEKEPAKKSCCGSCKKDAVVQEAAKECTKEGDCKKTSECKTGCESSKAAEKEKCSGGTCPLPK